MKPVAASRRVFAVAAVAAAALFTVPTGHAADRSDFERWLAEFRVEAGRAGITPATITAALSDLRPIPRVVALDRRQPETRLTLSQYLDRVVTPERVRKGRLLMQEHRELLQRIGREYGVQPRFIVALWGIESDFGRLTGGFPVVGALATLAHDGRRRDFFRGELLHALRIIDEGHIPVSRMTGSWAGAMGQNQFMPSSFRSYAVDHDGDGRRDIWGTQADVFASTANYLARSGWRDDLTWGRAVRLPPGFDRRLAKLSEKRPLSAWAALGVRAADGGPLPGRDVSASILTFGDRGPAFAVYQNFRVLLRWNRSNLFAVAVGTLSDAIAGG